MSIVTLARWLGPWADATKAPSVPVSDEHIAGLRVRRYGRPRERPGIRLASRGIPGENPGPPPRRRSRKPWPVLVAPGLHYAGPDDPRMDRFCRIMARAGHHVIAPFVPDYLALTPSARAVADFARLAQALPHERFIVFSISFGSLLALALAADHPDRVERLVVFGGYADFHETMRFCLTGEVASGRNALRDPLNQPVVLLNLLDVIDHDRGHRAALCAAWRSYVELTWGRPEMKQPARFLAVAEELAPTVPPPVRELFLVGIGARPGAWELARPALARFDASALDPSPYLPRIRSRVDLVHGADDDVIPYEQSHVLANRLVAADVRVLITGMYGHTGSQRPPLREMAKELATMVRVLRALS